jgi:alginate O-acetyltransferase complex protein AlgI
MSFTDPLYFVFLTGVFLLYYMLQAGLPRRVLLLTASYYFYFKLSGDCILVLFLVTAVTYYGAVFMRSAQMKGRGFIFYVLVITLVLIPLLVFKYLAAILSFGEGGLPLVPSWRSEFMSLALPIGISFFTFAAIGYLSDVYLELVEPERELDRVALFLAFFPVVSAGPIERAGGLMAQLDLASKFSADRAFSGLRLILIGLVLKMIFADNLQKPCDAIFAAPENWPPLGCLIGVLDYAFYLYTDFAGYTLIAIGSARLFDLNVRSNFLQPFLSATIPEFWRHWHISLSSWVRDYLFAPINMQLRRQGKIGITIALMVSFLVIGIWHGPTWGFVIFGLMHGILVTTSAFTLALRDALWKTLAIPPQLVHVARVALTFTLVLLTYVVFRAHTLGDAIFIYKSLFSIELVQNSFQTFDWVIFHQSSPLLPIMVYKPLLFIPFVVIGDIFAKKHITIEKYPLPLQVALYSVAIIEVLGIWMNIYVPQPFVYNKF